MLRGGKKSKIAHIDVKCCMSRDQATSITVRHCPIWRLNQLLRSQQQAKAVKLFEDRYSRLPPGTRLSHTSAKAHMAWSCKYFAFRAVDDYRCKTLHAHAEMQYFQHCLCLTGASLHTWKLVSTSSMNRFANDQTKKSIFMQFASRGHVS